MQADGSSKREHLVTAELISLPLGDTKKRVKMTLKSAPVSGADALARECRAFEGQRKQLMRRYSGEYVAMFGGRVVAHDKDDEALAARMFRKLGDAPFYIGRVEDNSTICEVPSPELAD
jgi:hypothetical protein